MQEIIEDKIVKIEDLIESNNLIDIKKIHGRGGAFLVTSVDKGEIFSRELFSEDQIMFRDSAKDFAINRILPVVDKIEKFDENLSKEIFREMGELGFLGVDVPEEFGGMDLDKSTSCLIIDALSSCRNPSIMVTSSAHTGIGTLPIIWYGNESQKNKYLSKLTSGEWMGCFALTEPEAGSDALSGKMKAELSDDGKYYTLNGQKIYITNGGWADVCTVFASVDGKYTAFIVDKDCEGYNIGPEENKMGLKGSSTTTLFFEDCKVPVENVLGEVGQGGPIALNVLYTGRYKLGATTSAGSKYSVDLAVEFSMERKQFGRPIIEFGMIQRKIVHMARKSWEADALVYMTSGSIDVAIKKLDKKSPDYYKHMQRCIEDHAIESSICKNVGSEALAYCVDEGVQIFGGAGFIEDYPIAQMYRDERINRIFEGTNEINKLIISGYTMKKAILDEMPIREMILLSSENWINESLVYSEDLIEESQATELSRSIVLNVLNDLIIIYGQDFKNDQFLSEIFAEMVTCLAIMDTGLKKMKNIVNADQRRLTLPVVKLSVVSNYEEILSKSRDISSYIQIKNSSISTINKINNYSEQLSFTDTKIKLEKEVFKDIYKNKGYHLDI